MIEIKTPDRLEADIRKLYDCLLELSRIECAWYTWISTGSAADLGRILEERRETMEKKMEACIGMSAKQVAEEAEKRYKAITDILYPLAQDSTLEETPLYEKLISDLTLYMLHERINRISEEYWDLMKTVFRELYESEETARSGEAPNLAQNK